MKQILDFLLKIVEQDWFQLLLMCARFESSTVNRTQVIKVWNLNLPVSEHFVTLQWFHRYRSVHCRLRLLTLITFVLIIVEHSNLAHMRRLWHPLCSSINFLWNSFSITFSISYLIGCVFAFVSYCVCVFFRPGGKTDMLIMPSSQWNESLKKLPNSFIHGPLGLVQQAFCIQVISFPYEHLYSCPRKHERVQWPKMRAWATLLGLV